jgi:hypothetical protein
MTPMLGISGNENVARSAANRKSHDTAISRRENHRFLQRFEGIEKNVKAAQEDARLDAGHITGGGTPRIRIKTCNINAGREITALRGNYQNPKIFAFGHIRDRTAQFLDHFWIDGIQLGVPRKNKGQNPILFRASRVRHC